MGLLEKGNGERGRGVELSLVSCAMRCWWAVLYGLCHIKKIVILKMAVDMGSPSKKFWVSSFLWIGVFKLAINSG